MVMLCESVESSIGTVRLASVTVLIPTEASHSTPFKTCMKITLRLKVTNCHQVVGTHIEFVLLLDKTS